MGVKIHALKDCTSNSNGVDGPKGSILAVRGNQLNSFCQQVAAWFPDMFCNFYFMKILKIAKNSTTTKAREKITTDLVGIFRISEIF